MPLVVELHGGGGSGRHIDRLGRFGPLGDREGFVVVAPSAHRRLWNDGRAAPRRQGVGGVDDVAFIAAAIEDVAQHLAVDGRRIYAVGMSNGAMMVARLAAEMPDRIAAFAQVAGTIGADAATWWNPGRPIPLIQVHGTVDPIVPYDGGPVGGSRRRRVRAAPRRGICVGVRPWIEQVVRNNRATGPAIVQRPGSVTQRTWVGASPASDVEQWTIGGAGHVWPGGPSYLPERIIGPASSAIDATAEIWRFLSHHALG